MSSPLLALFVRSVREDCRRKLTYFARAGLVGVILAFLIASQEDSGWTNAPGLRFFETVVWVDLVFLILAGISYFASAISEEKEEMTLGLLRMTNLNPLSILLGKSTSRLCTAALLFAAQVPFTLLAVTLGGISLRQVFAAYLALGAFLIFVSNLALLGSVLFRRTSAAGAATGLLLLAFFMVPPLLIWMAQVPAQLHLLRADNPGSHWLMVLGAAAVAASPLTRFEEILVTGFSDPAWSFQVWSNLVMGVLCFLLAWAIFEKFCGEQKEIAPSRAGVGRVIQRRRNVFAPSRPWKRAVAWKDFYFSTGGTIWVFIKFLIYGVPIAIILFWPLSLGGSPIWSEFGVAIFWIMSCFVAVELAFAAASIYRHEHQEHTLSSLAMLPQGIRRVAYEKLLGILPSLAPAGTYLVLGLLLTAPLWSRAISDGNSAPAEWFLLTFLGSQFLFFLHLVALLSLYLKRGALPLAIGIHFLLGMFGAITASILIRDEAGLVVVDVVTMFATIVLHVFIGDRLETLAGED